jgi:hypothetical protein
VSQIEANILLAQSSEYSAEGGVSALGIGWQVRPPEAIAWALIVLVAAPRSRNGETLSCAISLERAGGEPVTDPQGTPLTVAFVFEPSGFPPESGLVSPILGSFSLNLPPLALDVETEYAFRLQIDGESRDHWVAPFRTMTEPEIEAQNQQSA